MVSPHSSGRPAYGTRDHQQAVRDLLGPALPTPRPMPLEEADGLPLAEPIPAREDSPAFANSAMDGFALGPAHRPGCRVPVGPEVAAGADPELRYPEGIGEDVAPIMTGARLPRGTRAVVRVEDCDPPRFDTPEITLPGAIEEGQFIRRAGEDIAAGAPLVQEGVEVGPIVQAALLGQGIERVTVRPRARVVIVTGGAEVGGTGPAAIRDTNGPMLAALSRRYQMNPVGVVRTDDDPERLRGQLARAIEETSPDLIVTSGGISHGRHEVVRQLLDADDPHSWFGHVAQQPGGPQGFGTIRGVPVICLPGNPMSTLVSFRLFVAPVAGVAPKPHPAALPKDAPALVGLGDDRTQFRRGRHAVGSRGELEARVCSGSGSHLLAKAAPATCLLEVPPRATLTAGDLVTIYPL